MLVISLTANPANTFIGDGDDNPPGSISPESPAAKEQYWVDSVFNSFSTEDKIAQLIFIKAFSNRDNPYNDSLIQTVKRYRIGGIVFFKGSPVRQVRLTNALQQSSGTPLFISIDAEWGLAMRLDSIVPFPKQMTLGASSNNGLIFRMGAEIARQCKRMGIQINFAPVVDINSNPKNPVINYRSFGENKESVAEKSIAYMSGMQKNNIITTAKHFPGHGDTDQDSHQTLPLISHSREIIEDIDLYPFRKIIKKGINGVMVAHLNVPALDTAKNLPSTLSHAVVTGLLRNELGFNGLIFTDALEMKGVANAFEPGILEVKALLAGNDILLMPVNVPKTIAAIKTAIDSSLIPMDAIDEKCKKILHYKYKTGLANFNGISEKNLIKDLHTAEADLINRQLYESAMTVVKNNRDILPLKSLDTLRLACLVLGDTMIHPFQNRLSCYAGIRHFNFIPDSTYACQNRIIHLLDSFNLVIVGIANTYASSEKNYNISRNTVNLINKIKNTKKIVLDLFANPYALAMFDDTCNMEAIVVSYEDKIVPADVSAQLIFGGIPAMGKLPVTASSLFPYGTGIETKQTRLKYTIPEDAGIKSADLTKVDTLALYGIKEKAYPGCQILIAKDGKVIYEKSFGTYTYECLQKISSKSIYDLASITKIAATTMAMMKLYDEKKIDLNDCLSKYLPVLQKTDKELITIRQVMAHQSGLDSWIPFYLKTLKDNRPDTSIYARVKTADFSIRVADNMYIRQSYSDTILKAIAHSSLSKKNEYKYSDLGFIMLRFVIEKITCLPFNEYLQNNFYKPLGLTSFGFQPKNKFIDSLIVPTEMDNYFRMQLIHGDVHDQATAMLGGISGHAGLFSDAGNLAVLMQVFLQEGSYGGKNYFSGHTVNEFTRSQYLTFKNRRGLGFDKPVLSKNEEGPTCHSASQKSYGHTGFTGTYAWADPDKNLIFIFLSNRTYPDGNVNKLAKLNIRTDIQQIIYDAIQNSQKK